MRQDERVSDERLDELIDEVSLNGLSPENEIDRDLCVALKELKQLRAEQESDTPKLEHVQDHGRTGHPKNWCPACAQEAKQLSNPSNRKWIEEAAEEICNEFMEKTVHCKGSDEKARDIIAKHHAKSSERDLLVRMSAYIKSSLKRFTASEAVMVLEDMDEFGLMGERHSSGNLDTLHPDLIKYAKEWEER